MHITVNQTVALERQKANPCFISRRKECCYLLPCSLFYKERNVTECKSVKESAVAELQFRNDQ